MPSADAASEASEASLALQLSKPVAALISVPLQLNYDQDIGPADDRDRWLLNVQPVIPFDLHGEWNLISRTILPLVRQSNGWTRGVLANHVWSFAGDDDRADINATFLQPFLTCTTPTQGTFALDTESMYDWEAEQWSVPVNVNASKLMRVGTQLVSLGGGLRYWADSPDSGAEGLGLRMTVTRLFPR